MSAAALLRDVKAAGWRLSVHGADLCLETKGEPLPGLLARLREGKAELVALLQGAACLHCGQPIEWRRAGVAFADGSGAHVACYEAAP